MFSSNTFTMPLTWLNAGSMTLIPWGVLKYVLAYRVIPLGVSRVAVRLCERLGCPVYTRVTLNGALGLPGSP